MPQQEAGSRSDKLLSDQKVYITRRILIVRRISPKRCSKCYIALFLSYTHLRRFYSLVNYRYYSSLSSINPQFVHKLIGPRNSGGVSSLMTLAFICATWWAELHGCATNNCMRVAICRCDGSGRTWVSVFL